MVRSKGQSYYSLLIAIRLRTFDWFQDQRLWVTLSKHIALYRTMYQVRSGETLHRTAPDVRCGPL